MTKDGVIEYVHCKRNNEFTNLEEFLIGYGKQKILVVKREKNNVPSALVPGFVIKYNFGQDNEGNRISKVSPVKTDERINIARFLKNKKGMEIEGDMYFTYIPSEEIRLHSSGNPAGYFAD
ncbi:MAG: hypothetical protein AABX28_00955 [Nanoarchaeota archaeon]